MTWRLAVINGPNMTRLGQREIELYGKGTWAELADSLRRWGQQNGHVVEVWQAEGEGELIRLLHAADERCDGVVLNPAAYTHTSVALRDALLSLVVPVVEVHLTQPSRREEFRQRNLVCDVVAATVQGLGAAGYCLALAGLVSLLSEARNH